MNRNFNNDRPPPSNLTALGVAQDISVALLTGGADRPYVFGLGTALIAEGAALDLIGSDDLDCPQFQNNPRVKFLNLRGNQRPDTGLEKRSSGF